MKGIEGFGVIAMDEMAQLVDYEYKYDERKGFDKKGNWIRKLVFMDKIPKYIIEREIEYYN